MDVAAALRGRRVYTQVHEEFAEGRQNYRLLFGRPNRQRTVNARTATPRDPIIFSLALALHSIFGSEMSSGRCAGAASSARPFNPGHVPSAFPM